LANLKDKKQLEEIKTIYFDYDGTLHNSNKIYAPAFRKAYDFLVENHKAEQKDWKDEEIAKWLGYTSIEMWKNFMGSLEESFRNKASLIIGQEMREQMIAGNAELYDNSLNTLKELKNRGYVLVFLSNCGIKYMETSRKIFDLDLYFDSMICSGMYDYIPKHEILKIIKHQFEMDQVIVGDRFHDIESGNINGIKSVFCEYGYGNKNEGETSTVRIKEVKELLNIFN